MPLQDTIIPIHGGQGVDTKTVQQLVPQGKLLQLQDAIFTNPGQVDKRNGYTSFSLNIVGGGTLIDPKMINSVNGEVVCASGNSNNDSIGLYSWSANLSGWVYKGPYISVGVGSEDISSSSESQMFANSIFFGNYAYYTWVEYIYVSNESPINPAAYLSVQDLTSKVFVASNISPFVAVGPTLNPIPKPVVIGAVGSEASLPGVLLPTGTIINEITGISLNTFTVSEATGVVTSSPVTLFNASSSFINYIGSGAASTAIFDTVGMNDGINGGVLAVNTLDGNMHVLTYDSAGNIIATATPINTGSCVGVQITVDPATNYIWVYYAQATALKYFILSNTLTVVLSPTSVASHSLTPGGQSPFFQVTAIPTSPVSGVSAQVVFYSVYNGVITESTDFAKEDCCDISYKILTATGGNPFSNLLIVNMDIYTRPFYLNGELYLGTIYRSINNYNQSSGAPSNVFLGTPGTENTLFIINPNFVATSSIPSSPVVAKMLVGSAFAFTPNTCGYNAWINSVNSTKIGFLASQNTSGGIPNWAVTNPVVFLTTSPQASFVTVDFNAFDAYQSLVANNLLLMNGGIVWQYDSNITCELGFNLAPEIVCVIVSTGGSGPVETYSAAVTIEWTDAQGNLYQSAPSEITYNITSTDENAQLIVKVPGAYLKTNPQLCIYTSQANGSVLTSYYQAPINAETNQLSYFVGASAPGTRTFYGNGGVLDNDAPPPALAMTLYNNRVWVVDSENPNTLWYTKTLAPLNGVNFSGNLTAQINAVGGSVVALAGMDSNLVIFEQNTPLVMSGDGANDVGQNSTLTNPQPIPSDGGCLSSRGVKTFPMGVMRKTAKGIYLLGRNLSDQYIGMPVEAYNSQAITDATLVESRSQIRFLTNSGLTLVYDYIFNQWSTFSNHQGLSATLWNGNYVYVRGDGSIYQESPGYYLDNITPFGMKIQTAWLALSSVQNFERIKEFLMLGYYQNGASALHGVQSSLAYNFLPSFITTTPFYFSASTTSPNYQYRTFMPRQKCDSLSILIQEQVTGDPSEYMTFTDMTLLAGVKKGFFKLPASQGVG